MRYLMILLALALLAPVLADEMDDYTAAMQQAAQAQNAGKDYQALQAYKLAVTAAEALPDEPELLVASSVAYAELLGRVGGDDDRNQQAADRLTRTLAVAEKAWGTEDYRLVEVLTGLAFQYWMMQKHAEAEASYLRALKIAALTQPEGSAELADAHYQLGRYYESRKAYAKGIDHLQQALAGFLQAYGTDHKMTYWARIELCRCLLPEKRYADMQAQLEPMVDFLSAVQPESPLLEMARFALSDAYQGQGLFDKAEPLELTLFNRSIQRQGADNPWAWNVNQRIARFYVAAKRPADAELYLKQAVSLYDQTEMGKPMRAAVHEEYAQLLVTLDRLTDAMKEYELASTLHKQNLDQIIGKSDDTGLLGIGKFYLDEVPDSLAFFTRFAAYLRTTGNPQRAARLEAYAAEIAVIYKRSGGE